MAKKPSSQSFPRPELLPDWQSVLSDESLRDEAGPNVFARGQTYAASGAVQETEFDFPEQGACIRLRAAVMGTQRYTCELLVNESDDLEGDCDCPHAEDGYFCKHQVALALTLRGLLGGDAPKHDPVAQKKVEAAAKRARTQAGNRDRLQAFIEGQSATVLAQRLWSWAEMDRDLMADLKAWAAQAQATDDPKAMKSVISDLLASSGFLNWRASGAYARRAEKVLPLLEKVLASDPVNARALCDHALRRLYKACEEADDSGGDIGGLMHSLTDLLLRSLRRAPPPATWLAAWFDLMAADPWGLWSEEAVLEAAGPAVREAYQQRAAKDWNHWVAAHPVAKPDVAADLPGRKPKVAASAVVGHRYDHERAQLRRRYLEVLKSQGDTQGVVDLMKASLDGAGDHNELVAYCEAVGRNREALQYALAACKQYPTDWRSEKDLLRCFERDGWDEEALAIRRTQLERSPTVEHFQAVLKAATAAGRETGAYRAELYAWAEQQTAQVPSSRPAPWLRAPSSVSTGRHVGTRAEWLLAEGKLDDALALVQPPHVCQPELLRRIGLKLPKSRHAEAVPLLLRVFAVAMPRSSTPYRDELALVREISSRMAAPERAQWMATLRTEYKAKRNFIKGLAVGA